MIKLDIMTEKMTLDELVDHTLRIMEDTRYDISRKKDPRIKRQAQAALEFWTAINEHLTMYRALLKDSTSV